MKVSVVLATLAFAATSWAADAQLVNLLTPDSKLLAGVQLQQARTSPFGKFLFSQMGSSPDLDNLRKLTGFDPLNDLTEIVASATIDGKGLIAGRGNFQPQLVTMLAAMGGLPTENYRGVALIGGGSVAPLPGQDPVVALLNNSLMVLGDRAQTKAAVDRWMQASNGTSPLLGVVNDISANSQAWAVATGLSTLTNALTPGAPNRNGSPQANVMQNVLEKIDRIAGGLNFGDTVTVKGQAVTKTPQDAQALAGVVNLLMAMQSPKTPLPFTPTISTTGAAVSFTLSITEQQLENLLKPAQKVQVQAAITSRP